VRSRRSRVGAPVLLLAAGICAGPPGVTGAAGQEVALRGAADVALDRRLTRLLEDGPLVVSRDTTIARGDTVPRSVLVLDASLVHEGVVLGDLVLVDAGAFVRPTAVVAGDLVNIAGGLYRSEIAEVTGRIIDLPTAPYRVVREADRLVIEATRTESRLVLDGLFGVRAPTYDRVNGLTLAWGAAYRMPALGDAQPRIHGRAGWHTQRGEATYGAELSLRRRANRLSAGHERVWETNERWIRGDLHNSLVYLWNGRDLRDYHAAERSWIEAAREFADDGGSLHVTVAVRGQVEDAASVAAGQPWFLWGSGTRPNLPVDDGRTASVLAAADVTWEGAQTRFQGVVNYEAARERRGGDFHFNRVQGEGSAAVQGLADHTLTIDFFLQRPVGDRQLPGQRWSLVGGPGTLHTLPVAEFRGDHVVFVETRYIVPLPDRLALPIVGAPRLHLIHATGGAWTAGEDRSLHQEVALEAQAALLYVRFSMVPDDPGTNDVSVGLAWPLGRRYPWERRRPRRRRGSRVAAPGRGLYVSPCPLRPRPEPPSLA
jgi:hypothetical protein